MPKVQWRIFSRIRRNILDYVTIHLSETIKQQSESISKWRNSWYLVYRCHYKYGILLVRNDSNVSQVDLLFLKQSIIITWRLFLSIAAYYRGAHAIIAVFDINDLDTLKSAERWVNEALQTTANDNPLIYLVGSKRDLLVRSNVLICKRVLFLFVLSDWRTNVCKNWADSSGNCKAFECRILVCVVINRFVHLLS